MKRMISSWVVALLIAVLVGSVNTSFAQEDSDTTKAEQMLHKIVKHDGLEYLGVILSDDGREVLIETQELGKIYIPKSEISSIKLALQEESVFKGKYREVGPFTTRYYFTNNALPIHKGEHYIMLHLYGPEVHFAVGERLSVGVMATWIASPIGLAAKYAIPTKRENLNFSVGTIMLSSGYLFKSRGYGGLHWGSATFGKPGKNLTVSAGYAYADLGFDKRHEIKTLGDRLRHGPVVGIGGLAPVGKKASFLFDSMTFFTEHHNYLELFDPSFGNDNVFLWETGNKVTTVLMPGMRFQSSERTAFQVALAGAIEWSDIGFEYNSNSSDTRSLPIPMCSWFIKL